MARSLALDLGSTRVKLARLEDDGSLTLLAALPAPPLSGDGLRREGDPLAYQAVASTLLKQAQEQYPGLPVGMACQRSSFVLWQRDSGRPITPLISWQDRRAEGWCLKHEGPADDLARATGLVLSPHYAGPKLTTLLSADPNLRRGMAAGDICFGTLESYLLWGWSGGRVHHTDLSMAARTMLVRVGQGDWDDDLLQEFGIPKAALPTIFASAGVDIRLDCGTWVTATVADQAAAALAVGGGLDTALINLGTGGFVLRAGGGATVPGYLTGPMTGVVADGAVTVGQVALEGTINGIGPALDALAGGPVLLTDDDPTPDAFCLPDSTGIGAPHWRPDLPQCWSEAALGLETAARRRVLLEGIVFRAWEIARGMAPERPPARILVAGGIANEPFVAPALGAVSGVPTERLLMPEVTLLGAARLAVGRAIDTSNYVLETEPVASTSGAYLAEKYRRWQGWVAGVMASSG